MASEPLLEWPEEEGEEWWLETGLRSQLGKVMLERAVAEME